MCLYYGCCTHLGVLCYPCIQVEMLHADNVFVNEQMANCKGIFCTVVS